MIAAFMLYILPFKWSSVKRNTADKCQAVKNKNRTEKGFRAKAPKALILLAERVGFEPTAAHHCT